MLSSTLISLSQGKIICANISKLLPFQINIKTHVVCLQYLYSVDMKPHSVWSFHYQFSRPLCVSVSVSLSLSWSSHDPSQYSDDVFKQWCMKFGQIKTFVLPHWLIIWQIGALLCVDTVKEPSAAHPPPNKENSSIATLFYSLLEDYIFSPHFGMTKWGRTVGFLEGDPVCSGSDRGGQDSSQWQFKKIFSSRNI